MHFYIFIVQNLIFICLFKIIKSENDIIYIKINEEKEYYYNNENKYNFMVFIFDNYTNLPNNYFVHLYQIKGEISLYGLKCLDIDNSANITNIDLNLDINNIFIEFKKGNLLFPN